MKITDEWLRSVGFEDIRFSRNAIAVDMDGTYLCIDDDGLTVSLYDELDNVFVHIRPLNTQEEVRQLYKVLCEKEL